MARARAIALTLLLCLTWASAARAGVYSTVEFPEEVLSKYFEQFQGGLAALKGIGIIDPTTDPKAVLTPEDKRHRLVAALAAGNPTVELTPEERLNASAYLIRMKKYLEAKQILQPLATREQRDFRILSNLASAYHGLAGGNLSDFTNAQDYLSQALKFWPSRWEDLDADRKKELQKAHPPATPWDAARYAQYRQAEVYYRKLLRLRMLEVRDRGATALDDPLTVDAIFTGADGRPVRFVGASGKYEAGKIAAAEQVKLPPDALFIVEQLLVWWPNDSRLYWLLGELFNARGETAPAAAIFGELVGDGFTKKGKLFAPELRDHLLVLRTTPPAPGRSEAAVPSPDPGPPAKPSADKPSETTGPDGLPGFLQTLGVGFLGGLVVALLGSWQLRELRRRRAGPVASGH